MKRWLHLLMMPAVVGWALANPPGARACPFCTAQALTFTEEIKAADVVIVARLLENPRPPAQPSSGDQADLEADKLAFEVTRAIKGGNHLGSAKTIRALYFGQAPKGTTFLMFGYEPKKLAWTTPLALSDRGLKYIDDIQRLPEKGPDRLAFFQEYLEDKEEMLGRDAYDEFAKAPYADIKAFKDRVNRKRILERIQASDVSPSYRRMYLSLLSVSGSKDDVPMLEQMIKSEDPKMRSGLDSLINCYIALKGESALTLIEDLFLKNAKADYTHTYAAIMAIRFQGEEGKVVPRERLVKSLRCMLDRPQLADLVIPDLARWQDWESIGRLVDLFKKADAETSWVRVPVINYLRECPKPEAKAALVELEKIDPVAVKQANSFFPFPAATEKKSDSKPAEKGK